ncbi:MAG: hypothetical protein JXA64_04505 [Candidatus Fermentibacteraceae bacterium]|nr:hypothetical protein [Candidatus Fermentibacteraceae bacterium]MBN2608355.1 hypothetical protein [Candidatus Fermentibacteraceae bacterium]
MNFIKGKYLFLLFLIPAVLVTYSTIFTTGRLPGGEMSDTVTQGYPFFTFTEESIRNGSLPHWNPYVFCGIPFYSSFSAPVFYPVRGLLLLLTGVNGMARFLFPVQMLLGGIFAWLFLGSLGVSRWGRIVGSIAFATTAWSNTLVYAGHGSKIICWSYLPLLLYGCEKWMQTGKGRFVALGSLAIGMQALASHPQMLLYSGIAALSWMAFRTASADGKLGSRIGRSFFGLTAIILLGVAIGAVQLLPGYNFSRYSTRGEDLALDQAESYSLPPEESLAMVFPHLFGYRHGFPDSSVSGVPLYFGRLGLRLSSEFTGVIVFILALAAFMRAPGRYRWPLLSIGLIGLLVSWGGYTPVFGVLYRIVPVLRKLRAPHMAAFLTTSAIALSAGPGFDALFRRDAFTGKVFLRGLLAFAGICVLIFLLAGSLLPGLQTSWWARMGNPGASGYGMVLNRRVDLASPDFIRAALASLLLAGLLSFRDKWKSKAVIPGAALTILIALETIPVDRDFQYYLPQTDVDQLYDNDQVPASMTGRGRLLPGGNEFVPSHIRSVSGYHAAKPAVSQDLQSMISSGGLQALRQTAFTVIQTQQGYLDYGEFRELVIDQALSTGPSYADTMIALLPEDPLPRTWFAASWTELSSSSCISLLMGGLDPQRVTILYQDPGLPDTLRLGGARADITVDEPERVVVSTENPSDGLLVLADTWYPRWMAFIDGEPSEILQANHWQRAVAVPAGSHEVEFRFDSGDVRTGMIISIAGLFSAFLITSVEAWLARRRKKA